MQIKGFEETSGDRQTPKLDEVTQKPLISKTFSTNRVDINVLKSKLKDQEDKDFRKNLIVFVSFVVAIGSLGIFLSI